MSAENGSLVPVIDYSTSLLVFDEISSFNPMPNAYRSCELVERFRKKLLEASMYALRLSAKIGV